MLAFRPGPTWRCSNGVDQRNHRPSSSTTADTSRRRHSEGFKAFTGACKRLHARGDGAARAAFRPIRCAKSRAAVRAAKAAIIFWGMGVSQHVHGTDNARCLIALALICGQIGRPVPACTAARAEQRAGRVRRRPDPDVLPGLSGGGQSRHPRRRRKGCGAPTLDPKRGLTVVEIMKAVHAGVIKGMYILGENPAMSDPDLNHAREALATSSISWCRTSSSPRPPSTPT